MHSLSAALVVLTSFPFSSAGLSLSNLFLRRLSFARLPPSAPVLDPPHKKDQKPMPCSPPKPPSMALS